MCNPLGTVIQTQRRIRHRFYRQEENKLIEGVIERCYSSTCEGDNTEDSGQV